MKKGMMAVCGLLLFLLCFFGRYQPVSLESMAPENIEVEVKGSVVSPGVYALPYQASVKKALEQAGGPLENADLDGLNLNRVLSTGDVVVVGQIEEKQKVSIGSASEEQLQALPGIGPAMAKRIIEYRSENGFANLEDLKEVKGIGDKLFEKLQDQIVL